MDHIQTHGVKIFIYDVVRITDNVYFLSFQKYIAYCIRVLTV